LCDYALWTWAPCPPKTKGPELKKIIMHVIPVVAQHIHIESKSKFRGAGPYWPCIRFKGLIAVHW
jgi:hypothetical protein